jgi:hypothetical protein
MADGQVRVALRQPWADRTTHVVFDPVEFLGRLAVLVPRPRVNLILDYGVLGGRAAWRPEVVPRVRRRRRRRLLDGLTSLRLVPLSDGVPECVRSGVGVLERLLDGLTSLRLVP